MDARRFARQMVLGDIGPGGQQALARARVVVVGAGGLGAPVLTYLASAGVGHITIVDDDVVEHSNLNRQTLFTAADVGLAKAACAARAVQALAPSCEVVAVQERVVPGRVSSLVAGFDVVVDCADGLPTKFLLNDACVRADKPLVHGAATAWDGEVLCVPGKTGPCLRCLFEEPPPPGSMPTCRTAGIVGVVTGVVGAQQAAEVLKVLLRVEGTLVGRLLSIDVKNGQFRTTRFARRADCAACGDAPSVNPDRADDYDVAG